MKRLLLLTQLCILFVNLSPAQSGIEVHYFTPLENAKGAYTQGSLRYTLWCKAERSLFFQESTQGNLDLDEHQQRLVMNFATGENWVYKDLRQARLSNFVSSPRDNPYRIEEELPQIKWQLLEENKSIEGIRVRKARGRFRGRNYTAWFAPDIPLHNGPWKLGGLPGLILEAYDDDRLVVFLFRSLQFTDNMNIEKPSIKAQAIDLMTYQAICRKEIIQYFGFLNARLKKEGSELSYQTGEFELWERLH